MTPLPLYLPDTHALHWHFEKSPKLSPKARDVFVEAYAGCAMLVVSHVVLAELFFLLQKYKKAAAFPSVLLRIENSVVYQIEPVALDDIHNLGTILDVPEMHDRLIAIQAKRLGATVVTVDPELQSSAHVKWVW